MRFRQINDIRNIIFLNLKSYLYLILEDISISETTSFPTTETTQDITYFETTTQRTVRQTTISANTPRAGEKPLTKEPENETSTQSISYTASPTQVFKGITVPKQPQCSNYTHGCSRLSYCRTVVFYRWPHHVQKV